VFEFDHSINILALLLNIFEPKNILTIVNRTKKLWKPQYVGFSVRMLKCDMF